MPAVPWSAVYPNGAGSAAAGGAPADVQATNPDYPGMPVGAQPIHRDLEVAAALTTLIWQPGPNRKAVVSECVISTDTGGRVAVVDGADVQGSRIATLRAGANGGAAPNMIPTPYVSKAAGNGIYLVSPVGNTAVSIRGWETDA